MRSSSGPGPGNLYGGPTGRHAGRQGAGPRRRAVLGPTGAACARHPWAVFAAWVVALVATLGVSHLAGGGYSDNVNLGHTQAYTGLQLLKASDRAASGYAGTVVFRSANAPLTADATAVGEAVGALARLPHVVSVSDPLSPQHPAVSADGLTAYITVHTDVVPQTLGAPFGARLRSATQSLRTAHLDVQFGGAFDQVFRPKAADAGSELIGFVVALVVLLVGFGSVAGAGLPLVTALFSVLVGLSVLGICSSVATFGTASPTLALMIGLGVGIDYAVFLTTRFRQRVADGAEPIAAAAECASSSGRAVVVAGCTVSVAMLGLFVSGISFIGMLGLAAVFGVVTAVAGAVTLVPAALGLLGRNVDRLHVRAPVAESGRDGDGWHRYADAVGRKPWVFLAAGLVLLGTLAVPLLSIRLGHVDDGADPASYTDKQAYDMVAQGFGPGANGPLTVVVDLPPGISAAKAGSLASSTTEALAAAPDVARAIPLVRTTDGRLLVGTVVPASSPQQQATTTLFNRLVGTTLPGALRGSGAVGYVSGATASYVQFASALRSRLPLVVMVVVATAFLLVLLAFRSLLLALKAAVLNLVSISAAYGVLVAVFQWGWGRSLLGVSENVPIESYVPVIMFAIVFGLSMDYEIFLLTRVKEHWDATGDHHLAVARGLSSTGRVITCAALIMASVFTAFVGSTEVVIKMLAVGLASSVVLDATVVRLLLVPAVMYILGPASWWLPGWLDRLLPRVAIERDGSPEPASPEGALPGP